MVMRWLPGLSLSTGRYFLPRSQAAGELLHRVLLSGSSSKVPASLRQATRTVLADDPPLLIHCVVSMLGERYGDDVATFESISLDSIGEDLIRHAGDRILAAGVMDAAPHGSPVLQRRFEQLQRYFQTLPFERWMAESALWLETTGPPLSPNWGTALSAISFSPDSAPTGLELRTSDQSSAVHSPDPLLQMARLVKDNDRLTKQFDAELDRQKRDSLRQLAYGLSHELNNPLTNISTRAQLLRRKFKSPDSVRMLDQMVAQVYRGHGMIADLMFYAKPPQPDLKSCEILSIVQSVISEFESAETGSTVEDPPDPETATARSSAAETFDSSSVRFQWQGESECYGDVDAVMIGELVRALVRNSVEAIDEAGLVIASVRCDDETITVQIADSGPGLSEAARQHAFDPYFSGREAGRGLGLGLCRAYRIAQLHGGTLTLAGGPAGCVATFQIPTGS